LHGPCGLLRRGGPAVGTLHAAAVAALRGGNQCSTRRATSSAQPTLNPSRRARTPPTRHGGFPYSSEKSNDCGRGSRSETGTMWSPVRPAPCAGTRSRENSPPSDTGSISSTLRARNEADDQSLARTHRVPCAGQRSALTSPASGTDSLASMFHARNGRSERRSFDLSNTSNLTDSRSRPRRR
jgi:hypothetical protein